MREKIHIFKLIAIFIGVILMLLYQYLFVTSRLFFAHLYLYIVIYYFLAGFINQKFYKKYYSYFLMFLLLELLVLICIPDIYYSVFFYYFK